MTKISEVLEGHILNEKKVKGKKIQLSFVAQAKALSNRMTIVFELERIAKGLKDGTLLYMGSDTGNITDEKNGDVLGNVKIK